MSKPITVIGKAKQLIEEVGHEEAIKHFEDRIMEMGEPKNFQDVCNITGLEVAIDFIKGKIK